MKRRISPEIQFLFFVKSVVKKVITRATHGRSLVLHICLTPSHATESQQHHTRLIFKAKLTFGIDGLPIQSHLCLTLVRFQLVNQEPPLQFGEKLCQLVGDKARVFQEVLVLLGRAHVSHFVPTLQSLNDIPSLSLWSTNRY